MYFNFIKLKGCSMKSNLSHYVSLLALAGLAGSALAAGNHAGGHDHASTAIGKAGDAAAVNRTINILMSDKMRFTPSSIKVKGGETIRFVLKNNGKLKHEMVLGSAKELKQHAEAMKKNPGMEHDDPNQVSVEPGNLPMAAQLISPASNRATWKRAWSAKCVSRA
jgi:uncharacterized cupredoxin-like copper-binding protein